MNRNDRISGGIFVVLGVCILILTMPFPSLDKGHPGPALFPNILAGLFVVFGGTLLWKARKPPSAEPRADAGTEPGPPQNLFNAFFLLGIIISFILLENRLGFLLTSFILLFLLLKRLGSRIPISIVVSVLVTIFVYALFYKILRVPLSPGLLTW